MGYTRVERPASPPKSPSPVKGRRSRSRSRSLSASRRSRSRSRDAEAATNPGNNLYVTGLSTRVTSSDLEKFCSSEGKVVECHLVTDPRTKESRGFGFVTMETNEAADRCVKYLNRSVLEGRLVTVEKDLIEDDLVATHPAEGMTGIHIMGTDEEGHGRHIIGGMMTMVPIEGTGTNTNHLEARAAREAVGSACVFTISWMHFCGLMVLSNILDIPSTIMLLFESFLTVYNCNGLNNSLRCGLVKCACMQNTVSLNFRESTFSIFGADFSVIR
nr:serine/arginine-rich splicing factor SR45a-like isoform X2 [Ipomoea batatas]